ncbi:MAG: hypothetical protein WBH44_09515, partial [Proteocatella sp.]
MINLKDNMEILRELKIIDLRNDESGPGFLLRSVDEEMYFNALRKMTDSEAIKAGLSFHDIALKLLGHEKDIDFAVEDFDEFVCSKGFSSPGKSKYTNGDFMNDITALLKRSTSDGIQFMEKLCLDGVFDDFNEGREIPKILAFDGKTYPVFEYDRHIFEKVYVEAPVDSD